MGFSLRSMSQLSCLVSMSDFFMFCITADGNVSLKKVMSDVTAVIGKLKSYHKD